MTTEAYEFWKMALYSPVGIALASGLGASFITLLIAYMRNRHESKIKKEEWERSEITRKEQRLFENKARTYEAIKAWTENGVNQESLTKIITSFVALSFYTSYEIRVEIRLFLEILQKYQEEMKKTALAPDKLQDLEKNAWNKLDLIHAMLLDDIDTHYYTKTKSNNNS